MDSLLLITGATGTLGQAFARACQARGLPYLLTARSDLDLEQAATVRAVIERVRPWAIINAAGWVRVDEAESAIDSCMAVNVGGPARLAEISRDLGIPFLTFSSDLVFDGAGRRPYGELDQPRPLSVYGASKAVAERVVLGINPSALVVRTSAFFGPWDSANFISSTLTALELGQFIPVPSDVTVSPTYVPELVHTALDLLIDGESGTWHLANRGEATWYELAREAAERAHADSTGLIPTPLDEIRLAARRPHYSALGGRGVVLMSTLDDALTQYFESVAASA